MKPKREHSRFMKATPEQCAEFYPAMLQNGQRHLRAAAALGKAEDYANGSAHVVLGGEEYLKAVVIFLRSKEIDLTPIKGLETLFYDHGPRHDVLKEMFAVLEVMVSVKLQFKKNVVFGAISLFTSLSKLKAANAWWNKAESLKQRAFYFDYTSKVCDPTTITIEDYEAALHRGLGIRDTVEALVNYINKMTPDHLDWFRNNFIDPDTLELLTKSIAGKSEADVKSLENLF